MAARIKKPNATIAACQDTGPSRVPSLREKHQRKPPRPCPAGNTDPEIECLLTLHSFTSGLAAWRNLANVGQGGGKGYAYNAASKRSKGPIITKYTPPPPQPSFGSGIGPYVPHPSGAHQSLPPYPGPNRPFQPYGTLPPPVPAGYPQLAYPYHLAPPYAAPAPFGPPHYGQHGTLGPLGPPPPSVPFVPGRPSAHEYRPPLSPYTHPSPHAPSSHRHAPAKHSPQRLANVRAEAPSLKSAAIPPKLPNARISHPLPPKPPPSHDQVRPQRDHKRKFERQHHQDKRHKSFRSTPPRPPPYSSPHRNPCELGPPSDRLPPSSSPPYGHSDKREKAPSLPRESRPASGSPEKDKGLVEAGVSAQVQGNSNTDIDDVHAETVTKPSVSANAEKEARPQSPDGIDRTPPQAAQERLPPPPRADSSGNAMNAAEAQGEAIDSPLRSDDQEDGEVSSDESGPSPTLESQGLAGGMWRSPKPTTDDRCRRTGEISDESDGDETCSTRPNTDGTVDGPKYGSREDEGFDDSLWDALDVPRQVDRKRRDSTASRASRHSSMSSKSSDLNSLEAELLGRPKNQRQPQPSPPSRQRMERRTPPKPKRRQNNTNSAYR